MRPLPYIILVSALSLALAKGAFSHNADRSHGFLPKNNLSIPVGMSFSNVSEQQFNEVIDLIAGIYRPIIKSYGAELITIKEWESSHVNAYAFRSQYRAKWYIEFFGGLARHPQVTKDGLAAVVCHEIGHHLGGAPIKENSNWSAAEGQADYYATLKCLRRVWQDKDNIKAISALEIPNVVRSDCDKSWGKETKDSALCIRAALAGLSTARLLQDLAEKDPEKIVFEKPDRKKVDKTITKHPKPQCRLDTFFAGSLCEVDFREDTDPVDPNLGTCTNSQGHTNGLRPTCWYKEEISI